MRLTTFSDEGEDQKMCEIGKPLEILDVQPLSLPAPLRPETEQPSEQPTTVEIPVAVERVTVGK